MDNGTVEVAEALQRIRDSQEFEFRLVALRDGTAWKPHTLIFDQVSQVDAPLASNVESANGLWGGNYGEVYLIRGIESGATVADWLTSRVVELEHVWKPGLTQQFQLPAFNGTQVRWQRFPSYATVDFSHAVTPIVRYEFQDGILPNLPQPTGFLVGDGSPFYPDFKTAVLRFAYGVSDPEEEARIVTVSPAIIVRLKSTERWLQEITLSPTAIHVTVAGSGLLNTYLTISGTGSPQFQERLLKRGTVECLLPNGIPSDLWIVLSDGNRWIDYYHRSERWPFVGRQPANVTIEAGDPATEIGALIAQGEGLTTEFKENVPGNRDQMLKTIPAFANGWGGTILLGVRDKTGEIVGDTKDRIDDLMQMIRDNVFPDPRVSIEEITVDHQRIVVISVPKGDIPPYGLHAKLTVYYVRRGATTFPARPEELRGIVAASQQSTSGPFAGYVM